MARVLRIDHIAIAVRDLEQALARYQALFGAELVAESDLTMNQTRMRAAYLKMGDGLVVLDGAVQPDGFLARFIEKRGEGLHHIAIAVDDLDGYVRDLEARGVRIPHREELGPLRREVLLSPRDTHGVVVQVIEWKEGDQPSFEERLARLRRFLRTQEPEGAGPLDALLAEAAGARARVLDAVAGLSTAQGAWKPAPAEWSVAECVEHLVLAEQTGVSGMWKAVAGLRRGAPVWSGEAVHRGRSIEAIVALTWSAAQEAPPSAVPRVGAPLGYWAESLRALQGPLEALGRELRDLDLESVVVPHVVSGPLDARQRLEFIRFHMDLHRAQLEAVRRAPGFPPA